MYADPQNLTINGAAVVLPRVGSPFPTRIGSFKTSDGIYELTAHQNSSKTRFRRELRLTQRKIAVDPISAVNKEVSSSVIIGFDTPITGFSNLELAYLSNALVAHFTVPNRDKLLGGEL